MVRFKSFIITLLSLAMLLGSLESRAQKTGFRYGFEWGVSSLVMNAYHYNFLTDEGFRVNDTGIENPLISNMGILGHIDLCVADLMTFSLCSGYMGVNANRRIIPVSGRVCFSPKGCYEDGVLAFIDAGIGINSIKSDYVLILSKAGTGYRYALSPSLSLDFLVNAQVAIDHPEVWDKVAQSYVSAVHVRRSDAFYLALGVSIALTF